MTPEEIDALIERAGLSEAMAIYESAIEIDTHTRITVNGTERYADGYTVLQALIAAVIAESKGDEMMDKKRTAIIMHDEFTRGEIPTLVSIAYEWLCEYVDEHGDNGKLTEFIREKIDKLPNRAAVAEAKEDDGIPGDIDTTPLLKGLDDEDVEPGTAVAF